MPEFKFKPVDNFQDSEDEEIEMEIEADPYLASAIEFMYSEDTQEDFNTMDR